MRRLNHWADIARRWHLSEALLVVGLLALTIVFRYGRGYHFGDVRIPWWFWAAATILAAGQWTWGMWRSRRRDQYCSSEGTIQRRAGRSLGCRGCSAGLVGRNPRTSALDRPWRRSAVWPVSDRSAERGERES